MKYSKVNEEPLTEEVGNSTTTTSTTLITMHYHACTIPTITTILLREFVTYNFITTIDHSSSPPPPTPLSPLSPPPPPPPPTPLYYHHHWTTNAMTVAVVVADVGEWLLTNVMLTSKYSFSVFFIFLHCRWVHCSDGCRVCTINTISNPNYIIDYTQLYHSSIQAISELFMSYIDFRGPLTCDKYFYC